MRDECCAVDLRDWVIFLWTCLCWHLIELLLSVLESLSFYFCCCFIPWERRTLVWKKFIFTTFLHHCREIMVGTQQDIHTHSLEESDKEYMHNYYLTHFPQFYIVQDANTELWDKQWTRSCSINRIKTTTPQPAHWLTWCRDNSSLKLSFQMFLDCV